MSSPLEEPATDRLTQVHIHKENAFGPFDQKFPTERLHVRNPANTFSQRIAGYAITADRKVTMPNVDADCSIAHRDNSSGLITTDQLGTGTPDNTKFLRGDQVWATPAGGGGGGSGIQVRENSVAVTAASRSFLNFLDADDFLLTDDAVDDEVEVTVNRNAANGIAGLDASSRIAKAQGHSATVYNDVDNDLGAHFVDISRVAAPANPSANYGRFYVKQVDANNDGVYCLIKRNGSFVEVQII